MGPFSACKPLLNQLYNLFYAITQSTIICIIQFIHIFARNNVFNNIQVQYEVQYLLNQW
jgi:hypothetical protein